MLVCLFRWTYRSGAGLAAAGGVLVLISADVC
jgi:hypothetical protein